ncbi:MAG TPA: aminotransferase class III-fold pyridoxal phosphate-dependent enzyme [Planctomycetota bacterium]|nr:aminotransferase class III-fold pyridoxal phosphate-dependent enzyme [Planctomycetota bacterium]
MPSPFPGPESRKLIAELERYVLTEPWPFVVDIERSSGMWLATVDGQRIFDWAGYYGSKLIGHNHPRLNEPDYLRRLALAANNKVANLDFLTPECLEYYRLLRELAPRCMLNDKLEIYAVNSGAEAVENMMKYFINLHDRKCLAAGRLPSVRRFIYFDQAFHGRTVFALNITQQDQDPILTKDFRGLVPGNLQVPFPAVDRGQSAAENRARTNHSLEIIEDLLVRYRGEIVGIVVEPIQGAGGHRLAEPEFFRGLSELAHRHETYLGFDEVQTAGGQTGTFFAIDQFGLPHPPQAVAAAKKLGCGVIYMLHHMEDLGVLDSTWGGSLADMVRFVQEMTVVRDERLIEKIPERSARLMAGLEALAAKFPELIGNVRGMGTYAGFTTRRKGDRNRLLDILLQEESTMLLGAGVDSIRLRPSLSAAEEDIDMLLDILGRSLPRLEG